MKELNFPKQMLQITLKNSSIVATIPFEKIWYNHTTHTHTTHTHALEGKQQHTHTHMHIHFFIIILDKSRRCLSKSCCAYQCDPTVEEPFMKQNHAQINTSAGDPVLIILIIILSLILHSWINSFENSQQKYIIVYIKTIYSINFY